MRRFRNRLHHDAQAYLKSFIWEWRYIFKDRAVFFSFILVSLMVSFLYTYVYSEETLQDLPIGIVDLDHTVTSRQLSQMIDATSQVAVYANYTDEQSAKQAFEEQKIRGYVVITDNFSKMLMRNEQPAVSVYSDAAYILYYKQILTATKTAVAYMNAGVEIKKEKASGKLPQQARNDTMPVRAKVVGLYNPQSGYATFLIPIVFVIIFQTTILTAIGILGGTMREGNKIKKLYPYADHFLGALPVVMGKATTYLILGIAILLVMLGVVMPLFNIPMRTDFLSLIVFFIPFLLSLVYLGIFLLNFFRHREDAIMLIMYTSIPAMLITGFSWPDSTMPQWVEVFSYIVPSTLGTKGFIAMTQTGASLNTIQHYWVGMWSLCIVYLVFAVFSMQRMHKESKR